MYNILKKCGGKEWETIHKNKSFEYSSKFITLMVGDNGIVNPETLSSYYYNVNGMKIQYKIEKVSFK